LAIAASAAPAQDFIGSLFGNGKKSAPKTDPDAFKNLNRAQIPQEFLLTPKCGPHHIFVASYVGERGIEYALRLASELRSHGFQAYVHNHKEKEPFFRPDAKQLKEMRKQFMNVAPRYPQLKTPIQDNWVVVVGDFAGIENDRGFDAAMKKLKRLNRESFSPAVAVELRWGTAANGKDPNELVGLRGTSNPLRRRAVFDLQTQQTLHDVRLQVLGRRRHRETREKVVASSVRARRQKEDRYGYGGGQRSRALQNATKHGTQRVRVPQRHRELRLHQRL
jgi:hypothetical protein